MIRRIIFACVGSAYAGSEAGKASNGSLRRGHPNHSQKSSSPARFHGHGQRVYLFASPCGIHFVADDKKDKQGECCRRTTPHTTDGLPKPFTRLVSLTAICSPKQFSLPALCQYPSLSNRRMSLKAYVCRGRENSSQYNVFNCHGSCGPWLLYSSIMQAVF